MPNSLLSRTERRIAASCGVSEADFARTRALNMIYGRFEPAIHARVPRRSDDEMAHRQPPKNMHDGADRILGGEDVKTDAPREQDMLGNGGILRFAPLPRDERTDPTEEDRARREREHDLSQTIRQIRHSLNRSRK